MSPASHLFMQNSGSDGQTASCQDFIAIQKKKWWLYNKISLCKALVLADPSEKQSFFLFIVVPSVQPFHLLRISLGSLLVLLVLLVLTSLSPPLYPCDLWPDADQPCPACLQEGVAPLPLGPSHSHGVVYLGRDLGLSPPAGVLQWPPPWPWPQDQQTKDTHWWGHRQTTVPAHGAATSILCLPRPVTPNASCVHPARPPFCPGFPFLSFSFLTLFFPL